MLTKKATLWEPIVSGIKNLVLSLQKEKDCNLIQFKLFLGLISRIFLLNFDQNNIDTKTQLFLTTTAQIQWLFPLYSCIDSVFSRGNFLLNSLVAKGFTKIGLDN